MHHEKRTESWFIKCKVNAEAVIYRLCKCQGGEFSGVFVFDFNLLATENVCSGRRAIVPLDRTRVLPDGRFCQECFESENSCGL